MKKKAKTREVKPLCGLVMPISPLDGCSADHWRRVRGVIEEALSTFDARMVSEAPDSGIIQSDIVQNLATDPLVVCDVSGRNANVMVELGIRLALGKPVVIVKDDETPNIFDVDPLRYVPYRRDLRYDDVVSFKKELRARARATYERSLSEPEYSPFLEAFGTVRVPKLETEEVAPMELIADRLTRIERTLTQLGGASRTSGLSNEQQRRREDILNASCWEVARTINETQGMLSKAAINDVLRRRGILNATSTEIDALVQVALERADNLR